MPETTHHTNRRRKAIHGGSQSHHLSQQSRSQDKSVPATTNSHNGPNSNTHHGKIYSKSGNNFARTTHSIRQNRGDNINGQRGNIERWFTDEWRRKCNTYEYHYQKPTGTKMTATAYYNSFSTTINTTYDEENTKNCHGEEITTDAGLIGHIIGIRNTEITRGLDRVNIKSHTRVKKTKTPS